MAYLVNFFEWPRPFFIAVREVKRSGWGLQSHLSQNEWNYKQDEGLFLHLECFAGLSLVRSVGKQDVGLFSLALCSQHNSLVNYYRTVYVIPPFGSHLKVMSCFYEAGKLKKLICCPCQAVRSCLSKALNLKLLSWFNTVGLHTTEYKMKSRYTGNYHQCISASSTLSSHHFLSCSFNMNNCSFILPDFVQDECTEVTVINVTLLCGMAC